MIPFNPRHPSHTARILNSLAHIAQPLVWQQNRPIKRIRQASMTTVDHHLTDSQLAEDGKLPTERGIHGRVPETEADVRAKFISLPPNEYGWKRNILCRYHLKEIGKTISAKLSPRKLGS
ncbi:hypothetical protein BBP40_005738 [Aspergillus hancockii]|nr:hypothetical protein BBP40_005738 [Aspergillus hancockii]